MNVRFDFSRYYSISKEYRSVLVLWNKKYLLFLSLPIFFSIDLQHLVAEVVDDLDSDASCGRWVEWTGNVFMQTFPGFFVDLGLQGLRMMKRQRMCPCRMITMYRGFIES